MYTFYSAIHGNYSRVSSSHQCHLTSLINGLLNRANLTHTQSLIER